MEKPDCLRPSVKPLMLVSGSQWLPNQVETLWLRTRSFRLILVFLSLLALVPIPPLRALPASPTLGVAYAAGQVTLSWQATNCWLQSATTLVPPSWVNVPELPAGGGLTNSLTLPANLSAQFFRLVYSPGLPPPTELTLEAEQDNTGLSWFALWWDEVPFAIAYNLYYAAVPGVTKDNYASLPQGAVLTGITTNYVILTNLLAGVQYYFVATAVSLTGESSESDTVSGIFGPFGTVSGTVSILIPDGTNQDQQAIPGATITLSNPAQTNLNQQTMTDQNGDYSFTDQPAGSYQLCWSAPGFVSGCYSTTVVVSNNAVYLNLTLTNDGSGLLYGHVSLADGSAAVQNDPFFDIQTSVAVSLRGSSPHPVRSVAANDAGDYLMANLAPQTGLSLVATNGLVGANTNVNVAGIQRIDFALPDSPPQIISLTATTNGVPVMHAAPGATLQVTVVATNATGGLHYAWFPGPDTTNLVSADAPTIPWTLPSSSGDQWLYVKVSDGSGGFATARVDVTTDPGLLFTGEVLDTNGVPIAGASIQVNNATTISDTNGYFSIEVTNLATAYTVVATQTGYVPFTKTFDDVAQNILCTLVALPPCNPDFYSTNEISLSDSYGDEVIIPANSLARASGGGPTNPVCVTFATFDPCAGATPLNLTSAAVQNGTNVELNFLALTTMSAVDATGEPLVLNGPLALTLAGSTNCFASLTNPPPPNTQVWWYDATAGVWRPTGDLASRGTPGGPYTGFPAVFGFLAFAVPAAPADSILKIKIEPTLSLPLVVIIRDKAGAVLKGKFIGQTTLNYQNNSGAIVFQPNGDLIISNEFEIDPVPAGEALTVQVISPKEAPGVFPATAKDENKTVIASQAVPAIAAGGSATVSLGLTASIANLKENRVNKSDMFLTGKFGVGTVNIANAYYQTLDAINANNAKKTTFSGWLKANGFLLNPAGDKTINDDASATFFNACDLGFGRSMHMKITKSAADPKGGNDFAFYVSNFISAGDAVNNANGLIATVAMDYVYDPKASRVTTFYVYNKAGGRLTSADLDGRGQKYVPNLCMVCHGGTAGRVPPAVGKPDMADTNAQAEALAKFKIKNGDVEAHFIPFDASSYTYEALAGGNALAGQTPNFTKLNAGVLSTDPTSATTQFVDGFGGNAFPPGWNANATIQTAYTGAFAISCRACHLMRDPTIDFVNFKDLDSEDVNNLVNKIPNKKVMPNALRTFTLFWGSRAANLLNGPKPDQPDLLLKQALKLSNNPSTPP